MTSRSFTIVELYTQSLVLSRFVHSLFSSDPKICTDAAFVLSPMSNVLSLSVTLPLPTCLSDRLSKTFKPSLDRFDSLDYLTQLSLISHFPIEYVLSSLPVSVFVVLEIICFAISKKRCEVLQITRYENTTIQSFF